MFNFERNYALLVQKVLLLGVEKQTRNAVTRSVFGESFSFDMSDNSLFPLLLARRIYYKGVLGELAAMLRGPKHIKDFEKFGCNYWKSWAEDNGGLNVDYGNLWLDWNGYNQLQVLVNTLKSNPNDRRLMINSWKPDTMDKLSLPCCHFNYQWYVRTHKGTQYLDMLWSQRSCDVMIGLPSDIVLAAVFNILIANNAGMHPGKITMSLGDTHIYAQHFDQAFDMYNSFAHKSVPFPTYSLASEEGMPVTKFTPEMLEIENYQPEKSIKFDLIK